VPRKLQSFSSKNKAFIMMLAIPLVISAFTHIWNPIGFPSFHVDEGHYMRRAMQVMDGLGPQESKETYDYGYDHPYFGQIFLAASLSLVNFPDSLHPTVNLNSIEMLYLVPRILMGIIAVVDTFLVYKIAETRYNRKIAFISATLFAVMPLSGILRGILLDSIELPFILLSILFAVYFAKYESQNGASNNNKKFLLVLISGIFLGLAIFTKVPVFTLIPLLAFIILQSNKKGRFWNVNRGHRLKTLALWFVPVVLIPMIWPAYALSVGQFGDWLDGVVYQAGRQGGRDLAYSLVLVTQIDPFLVVLGLASVIYCAIKKDYFVILWTVPYLVFLYLIGWVVYFHWSILVPILCIGLGILVENLRKRFVAHKFIGILPYAMLSGIAIFGFFSISLLTATDLNASYNEVYLFVTQELKQNQVNDNHQNDNNDYGTTLIGSHRIRALFWIPKYVFNYDVTFRDADLPNDNFTKPIETKRFLLVADGNLLNRLTELKQHQKYAHISQLYYNKSETIATFIDEASNNKYNLLKIRENHGLGPFIEVKANY
jgi:dolichyl-phosphate-mannose-protein mannosyltransferase